MSLGNKQKLWPKIKKIIVYSNKFFGSVSLAKNLSVIFSLLVTLFKPGPSTFGNCFQVVNYFIIKKKITGKLVTKLCGEYKKNNQEFIIKLFGKDYNTK